MSRRIIVTADSRALLEGFLQGVEFVNDSALSVVEESGSPPRAVLMDSDGEDDEESTVHLTLPASHENSLH